jgi:hypothetical protein
MQETAGFIKILIKMTTIISEAEKMIKRLEKKGEIEILDNPKTLEMLDEIFDKVDTDMENFRIDNNYKLGISLIDAQNVVIYQNSN